MAHLIFSALPQPRRPMVVSPPHLSVTECIKIMTEQDIGALVIKNSDDLQGIISERDIMRACLYEGRDPDRTKASDIVYRTVSVLNVFDPVEKAMEIITSTKRRHVLVSEEEEIIAILSIGDLLFHLLEDKTRVIEQLENYIHTY